MDSFIFYLVPRSRRGSYFNVADAIEMMKLFKKIIKFNIKQEQLSPNSNGYLPGLLYLTHFLVVLRH